MTNEQVITRIKHNSMYKDDRETADYIIKALEQQPCEDCVSRAEMLKYQQYLRGKMPNEENQKLWEFIKALPPVTPTHSTCKDCKQLGVMDCGYYCKLNHWGKISKEGNYGGMGDFYCSDFERRGNENDR